MPDLAFKLLVKESLVVILPNDHRLAALKSISPRDLMGETFVVVSDTAPVLRAVIDDYLQRSGVDITPAHEADHLAMGMSLIASTRGVGLLPAYAENFLASSLTRILHYSREALTCIDFRFLSSPLKPLTEVFGWMWPVREVGISASQPLGGSRC
jgi:DNA-binding transcriptional LysR family regulator